MIGKQTLINDVVKRIKSSSDAKTKRWVEKVVDNFLDSFADFLSNGEKVALQSLFSISVIEKAARKCKNPKTGEEMMIPKRKAFSFKASLNLKNRINEKK